jgi:enterochelin esterase-like enzyme
VPVVTADTSAVSHAPDSSPRRWSRRRVLVFGVGGVAVVLAGGALGLELVSRGVLPGQQELDRVDGACSVDGPAFRFYGRGSSKSGTFASRARRRQVGYTVAWPPGHGPGSTLPLVVMLHGEGGNHSDALSGLRPEQAVALEVGGQPLPPMGLVTVDGGSGYWNPHPDDDPMAMVVDELIPMCQALGLGRGHRSIGTMGISMGGYGALLLAEKYPELIGAVAAISPAVWTSYAEAQAVNSGAYASAAAFSANDVVTHADALGETPVRVASGFDDPFHPGVVALSHVLPSSAVEFSQGCHTGDFFTAEEPPSLQFLGRHLG